MRLRRILDREKTHEFQILKSMLFSQNSPLWEYKHNVTRVSNWENLLLASRRTVANTRVVCQVHSGEVELGESSPELKKNGRNLLHKETRDRIRPFFQFWGRLPSFHFSTVDVTHTRVRHCSPLGQNKVFSVRNTRDVIYSTKLSGMIGLPLNTHKSVKSSIQTTFVGKIRI